MVSLDAVRFEDKAALVKLGGIRVGCNFSGSLPSTLLCATIHRADVGAKSPLDNQVGTLVGTPWRRRAFAFGQIEVPIALHAVEIPLAAAA